MAICNACRYCEGYCAVFPAMERRATFTASDLNYLANLCHDCGECLYACQYAPPHEFAVNVPKTFAQIRLRSYENYGWPRSLFKNLTAQGLVVSVALCVAFTALMFLLSVTSERPPATSAAADFYSVIPHHVMVGLFGAVFGFASAALAVGFVRFWRDANDDHPGLRASSALRLALRKDGWLALRDVLTLTYLQGSGTDCTQAGIEARTPWRRRFHHFTYDGFLLCFGATSVAAIYHLVFGWIAPYPYLSVPVVLGVAGGIGLIVGPIGLLRLKASRDAEIADASQRQLDISFILLLLLTSVTGFALLIFRETAAMASLLLVHLGVVLALFVTLPYGKFVHGIYRSAALLKYAKENREIRNEERATSNEQRAMSNEQ